MMLMVVMQVPLHVPQTLTSRRDCRQVEEEHVWGLHFALHHPNPFPSFRLNSVVVLQYSTLLFDSFHSKSHKTPSCPPNVNSLSGEFRHRSNR